MRPRSGLEVLGLRDFRLVFGAALVSLLGDGIVPVAVTFAVLDLTGSASDLGIVLAARSVMVVASLLVGGVVADRVSRRTVMMCADLARLGAQGAIGALLVSGHATVPELAVSEAVLGAGMGFFNPASSGLIPSVAGEWLQQATSLRGMAQAAGAVAGPAIGGALVVATGPGYALLIDAASYAVSALLLSRVRDAGHDRAGVTPGRFVAELRAGFYEVRSRTWLWATVAAMSVTNLAGVAFPVLGALVAKRALGGAGAWAVVLCAQGVGSLAGGSALLRVRPRRPLFVATLIGLVPALTAVLLAIPAPLAAIAASALAGGIGTMVFNTLWETTLQQHIPEHARSRVSSYDWFGSLALSSAGLAAVGPVAGVLGTATTLYACAGLELASVGSLLLVRDIRALGAAPVPVESSPGESSVG